MRTLRTAAGRRALQLAVLVGGLFALGFLCGEQAHAADRIPAPTKATSATSVTSVVSGQKGRADSVGAVRTVGTAGKVADRVVAPVRGVVTGATQSVRGVVTDTSRSTRGLVTDAPGPVRDAVTATSRSVRDLVTAASQSARDVVTATSQSVQAAANRSVRDTRKTGPSLPLPGVDQVPDLDQVPGLGQVTDPQVPAPRERHDGTTATPANARQHTARAAATASASAAVAYGPEATRAPRRAARIPAAHRTVTPGDAPGRPAPGEDPDGLLGKQAADGSAFRHGDAYAVTLSDRTPVRLAPGVTARVDAPATRERHRDIPVFPG